MMLVFIILFAAAAYSPGATQASGAVLSNAYGNTGGSASTTSFSSSPSTGGGLVRDCTYNICTPTCSVPSPPNCPKDSNPCNCPKGTIVSECVPKEECEQYINCKGDYNARYTDCPIACPSTCAEPDAKYCDTLCGNLGCECKPGYLLSDKNGKCIKPEQCPGGNPCGLNATFVNCLVNCLDIYCPVNDDLFTVVCDPPFPCPSGCACQRGYRRNNVKDYKCIDALECPPVNCTRPNEEWSPCPENLPDSESSVGFYPPTGSAGPDCKPQCVCKQGFIRNGTDICVPVPPVEECATYD